jgi:hypothetical protein
MKVQGLSSAVACYLSYSMHETNKLCCWSLSRYWTSKKDKKLRSLPRVGTITRTAEAMKGTAGKYVAPSGERELLPCSYRDINVYQLPYYTPQVLQPVEVDIHPSRLAKEGGEVPFRNTTMTCRVKNPVASRHTSLID